MSVSARGAPAGNNFNLLRLSFAALVVLSHSFELIDRSRVNEPLDRLFHTYSLGDLAVDGFFTLSGFLILKSWQRDPGVWRYLARRALRIYPLFIVSSLLCGLLLGPLFGGGAAYFARFHAGEFLQWMLLLREPAVPPVFLGLPYTDVNGPMWTIQYEFMCYLLVALAGWVLLAGRAWFWRLLWAGAMLVNLVYADRLNDTHFFGSRLLLGDEPGSFVRFLSFFSAGAVLFMYRDRVPYRAGWAALCALVCVLSLVRFDAAKLILPTAGAYLLFFCAFAALPAAGAIGWAQGFVRRNDLSYGIYLFGWPVQQILLAELHLHSPWILTALALPCAAVCAFASWRLIERRCLSLKPRARA